MRLTLRLTDAQRGHVALMALWNQLKPLLLQGRAVVLVAKSETRSTAQNALFWSCLTDLSRQVKWFGKHLQPESWKHFLTAHLNGQELVPNMDGTGFVALAKGKSTSDMTIAEMTAVIELAHAFGTEQSVSWSPTSLGGDWPEGTTTTKPTGEQRVH